MPSPILRPVCELGASTGESLTAVTAEDEVCSVVEGACCGNEDEVMSAGMIGLTALALLDAVARIEVTVVRTLTVESVVTVMAEVEVLGLAITVTTVATPEIEIVWFPVLQSQPSSPPQQNVLAPVVQFCMKLPPS